MKRHRDELNWDFLPERIHYLKEVTIITSNQEVGVIKIYLHEFTTFSLIVNIEEILCSLFDANIEFIDIYSIDEFCLNIPPNLRPSLYIKASTIQAVSVRHIERPTENESLDK